MNHLPLSISIIASILLSMQGDMPMGDDMDYDQFDNKFPTKTHVSAYKDLSKKNRRVYHVLPREDRDRVAKDYKKGNDHQLTISRILDQDQREHMRMKSMNNNNNPNKDTNGDDDNAKKKYKDAIFG